MSVQTYYAGARRRWILYGTAQAMVFLSLVLGVVGKFAIGIAIGAGAFIPLAIGAYLLWKERP